MCLWGLTLDDIHFGGVFVRNVVSGNSDVAWCAAVWTRFTQVDTRIRVGVPSCGAGAIGAAVFMYAEKPVARAVCASFGVAQAKQRRECCCGGSLTNISLPGYELPPRATLGTCAHSPIPSLSLSPAVPVFHRPVHGPPRSIAHFRS